MTLDQLTLHYIYMSGIELSRPFRNNMIQRLEVLIKGNFNWYKEMGIYVWGRQMTVHMCSRVFKSSSSLKQLGCVSEPFKPRLSTESFTSVTVYRP